MISVTRYCKEPPWSRVTASTLHRTPDRHQRHRPYDRHTGVFKGIRPNKGFLTTGGWGVWELAARYSFLDLDAGRLPANALTMQDFTVGVNWYLNSNVRSMWNYVYSWGTDPTLQTPQIPSY